MTFDALLSQQDVAAAGNRLLLLLISDFAHQALCSAIAISAKSTCLIILAIGLDNNAWQDLGCMKRQ